MTLDGKILDERRKDLERQELEAPYCKASPSVYAQLMLNFMLQKDLCQCKFVWKRIPQDVRDSDPSLERLWNIGKALYINDPKAVFQALNQDSNWGDDLKEYINQLKGETRRTYLEAVGKAYGSISLLDFSQYVGLGQEEAIELARTEDWQFEPDTKMIIPKICKSVRPDVENAEQKLKQLASFVSFMEN